MNYKKENKRVIKGGFKGGFVDKPRNLFFISISSCFLLFFLIIFIGGSYMQYKDWKLKKDQLDLISKLSEQGCTEVATALSTGLAGEGLGSLVRAFR